MLNIVDIITAKRDGKKLSKRQIAAFVDAYTREAIPDYQAAAFLMAAFCRGMDADETTALTYSMLHSGKVLDFSDIPGPKVDKHSTGGVGDKISLVLVPLVVLCGLKVPMIAGRGLGITGGTIDKVESIAGLRTDLTALELHSQLAEVGGAIVGQTDEIAPADKLIYVLRDATATVDFIPFISASILSKKLAEGLDGLVLDVKCGRGAFMKTEQDARRLAESLVSTGLAFGVKTTALITRMDQPLGRAIGNRMEVAAATRFFARNYDPDVKEITMALAGEMLYLGGLASSPEEGRETAQKTLDCSDVGDKFTEMVMAQGGDPRYVSATDACFGERPQYDVYAPDTASGYVSDTDAGIIGRIATNLGVGRAVKEDTVDPDAGIFLWRRTGDEVRPGDRLATICTAKTDQVDDFHAGILSAYRFSAAPPAPLPGVMGRLTQDGWE